MGWASSQENAQDRWNEADHFHTGGVPGFPPQKPPADQPPARPLAEPCGDEQQPTNDEAAP